MYRNFGTHESLVGNFVTDVTGAGANPSARYGDYNALTLDPVDDCTFWFTGEYNPTSSWGTRISTFRFAQCPLEFETFVGEEEVEPEECEPSEENSLSQSQMATPKVQSPIPG